MRPNELKEKLRGVIAFTPTPFTNEDRVDYDGLAWQVLDSAVPTGLFAHSWGLESMWQHGEIETLEDLRVLTQSAIVQSGYATLPFVNAAFDTLRQYSRSGTAVSIRGSSSLWTQVATTAIAARTGNRCLTRQ